MVLLLFFDEETLRQDGRTAENETPAGAFVPGRKKSAT